MGAGHHKGPHLQCLYFVFTEEAEEVFIFLDLGGRNRRDGECESESRRELLTVWNYITISV